MDVAKALPFVPRLMLLDIIRTADAPKPHMRLIGETYRNTPLLLSLHGRELPSKPTRGMKVGCPVSLTLFLLYYDMLRRETLVRLPRANLYGRSRQGRLHFHPNQDT